MSDPAPFHPVRFAMDRLFKEDAPYSAIEIVVVIAVVRHMNRDRLKCWPSFERLHRQTRLSVRTVQRALRKHCEGPLPLLKRNFGGAIKSYTYELVRDPAAFAAARPEPRRRRRKATTTHRPAPKPTLVAAAPITARNVWMGQCKCGMELQHKNADGVPRNFKTLGPLAEGEVHACNWTRLAASRGEKTGFLREKAPPERTFSPFSERTLSPTNTGTNGSASSVT